MAEYDKLKRAFIISDSRAAAALEENAFPGASAEFCAKVDKLTRRYRSPFWKYVNTAGKKAAAVIVAVIILFSASLSVRAVRDTLLELLAEVHDTFTSFFVKDDDCSAPDTVDTRYMLSYVPEGYALEQKSDSDMDRVLYYAKGDHRYIVFSQLLASAHIAGDTEGVTLYTFETEKVSGYCYTNKGASTYVWAYDKYVLILTAYDDLPEPEMIKMIDNVVPD